MWGNTTEALIATSPNQNSSDKTQFVRSFVFPFFTIEIIVLFNTWAGFLRFLRLDNFNHQFTSFQTAFFIDDILLLSLPIIWGVLVWIFVNSLSDTFKIDDSVGLVKTFTYLVSLKGFINGRTVLFVLGCAIPYFLHWLTLRIDFLAARGPFISFFLLFIFWILMALPALRNDKIHKKRLFEISLRDLRRKTRFYFLVVPLIIPLTIVMSLQIIPENIGKVWGIHQVYSSIKNEAESPKIVNLKPEICWINEVNKSNIGYFIEFDEKVVYIKWTKDRRWTDTFQKFLINFIKGKYPSYELCVIPLPQMRVGGAIDEFINVVQETMTAKGGEKNVQIITKN